MKTLKSLVAKPRRIVSSLEQSGFFILYRMKNGNSKNIPNAVQTSLPGKLLSEVDKIGLSRIMKDKAIKLLSILLLKEIYNGDLATFIPLSAHYLEKAFNKEYHKDFFNKLKSANIIQSNETYKQGSCSAPGIAKGYRINGKFLNGAYVPVFYEDRSRNNEKTGERGKTGAYEDAEIYINRTYYYQDTCDNLSDNSFNNTCILSSNNNTSVLSTDNYTNISTTINLSTNSYLSTNTNLSMHISSRLFQKSLLIDDLSSLVYDNSRIWQATKERIAYISSRLFVDDKILRNSFEVTNCLLNFTYYTTKEKALIWAKEHDANLIQDGRQFYISELDEYVKKKKLNVYRNYRWQMARIKDNLFYAKRNLTNGRVDHNLTCAGKNIMEIIKEDNDLTEIDIKNSQFAIHAYWMKQAGMCIHEDVRRYYDMCSKGILYEEVGKYLGIERESAKQLMFEMVFSNRKFNTASKREFGKNFPHVIAHIDGFKKEKKNSNLFSIELQQLESEMVIDNLYPNIKELGIFCLTKHDSIIIKRSDERRVIKTMESYFKHLEFECVLAIDGKNVPITNDTTIISRTSDRGVLDAQIQDRTGNEYVRQGEGQEVRNEPRIKPDWWRGLDHFISYYGEDGKEMYEDQFDMLDRVVFSQEEINK